MMHLAPFLLSIFGVVGFVFSSPLLLANQGGFGLSHKFDTLSQSSAVKVRLHFESSWAFDMASQNIDIPLGKKLSTRDFARLPVHPQRARIVDAFITSENGKEESHYDGLNSIICVANLIPSQLPRISGRTRRHMGEIGQTSIWWKAENGLVNLEDSRNVWFLGGRAVDDYECF